MAQIIKDYAVFQSETTRLLALLASTSGFNPSHRKYIAEIAHLRLSILIENTMKTIFTKICCGALYIDGSAPILLATLKNAPAAINGMKKIGRTRDRSLSWNDGSEIRDNIKYIVDISDKCHGHLVNHAGFMTQIRYVRNHIAHKNDGTRKNFAKIVLRYYGANVPGITCGNLLVSPRVSPTRTLLETYIITANVMMKDIVRA